MGEPLTLRGREKPAVAGIGHQRLVALSTGSCLCAFSRRNPLARQMNTATSTAEAWAYLPYQIERTVEDSYRLCSGRTGSSTS
jgi:hypothetical protein